MNDILSLPGGPATDFDDDGGEDQVNEAPLMGEVGIAQLREQWDIPRYADIVLAGSGERVHVDHQGYCVFYAYPFKLGFRLPLNASGGLLSSLQGVPWSTRSFFL